MPTDPKSLVLFATATVNADITGSELVLPAGFSRMIVKLQTGAATGTTPTLNCYVQEGVRDIAAGDIIGAVPTGTVVWNDYISFTQVTGAATRYARIKEGSSVEAAVADAALTAGTIRSGPIPQRVRVKMDIGGTSPSFATVSVIAELLP